jgi:hypothetical protein
LGPLPLLGLLLLDALAAAGAWQPLRTGPVDPPVARISRGTFTTEFAAVAGLAFLQPDGAVVRCSGTLVAPAVVLTAAHCLEGRPVAGIAALLPDGVTPEGYDAVAYVVHPDYVPGRLAFADIALLALEAPVAGVTPMPLASVAPQPGTTATIVGFGSNEAGLEGLKQSGTVRLRHCPRLFRPARIVRGQLASSLCWRPRRRGQDTCRGDSGGPLLVGGAVAGVTSGGYPRCPGRLSWDTNVALYRPWIEPFLAPP